MRDSTRDYTIAQFRAYAALDCPTKEQIASDETMHQALRLDLLAVIDTLNILTSNGKEYIRQAVCAVYFPTPTEDLKKGEINSRVMRYALKSYTDERTVWRWLKEARLLCANLRGLNTGSCTKCTKKDVSRND